MLLVISFEFVWAYTKANAPLSSMPVLNNVSKKSAGEWGLFFR